MNWPVVWKLLVVGAVSGLTMVCIASAADWDTCADDLDRLRRSTRDASDKASEVKTKADELENCKRYPDVHDLLRDGCAFKTSEYRMAISDLESEMGTVNSRIRSARSSCGYDLGSTGSPSYSHPQSPNARNPLCDVYKSYKGKLQMNVLLQTCAKSMSEIDCRKCLSGN